MKEIYYIQRKDEHLKRTFPEASRSRGPHKQRTYGLYRGPRPTHYKLVL